MAFYGYTPQAKSFAGVGTAIGQFGAGVGAGVQEIETKRAAAVKAAENWEDMENAIKGIRANYTNYGQKLKDSGAITQEQFQRGLDQLRQPTRRDKSNPDAYLKEMQTKIADVYKIFAGKEDLLLKTQKTEARQQQLGGAVREAKQPFSPAVGTGEQQQVDVPQVGGQPEAGFTEETITERSQKPAAVTQEEITAQIPGQLGATTKELGQVPEFAGAPTAPQQLAQQKEERFQKQEAAAQTQQVFDNNMKRRTASLAQVRAQNQKATLKIQVYKAGKDVLTGQLTDINNDIKSINAAISQAKGENKELQDQNYIDQLEIRKKELDAARSQTKTEIGKTIQNMAKVAGIQPQREQGAATTPQEKVTEKFGYLPPEDMSNAVGLLGKGNPATGKLWTVDEVFAEFQKRQGGFTPPKLGG